MPRQSRASLKEARMLKKRAMKKRNGMMSATGLPPSPRRGRRQLQHLRAGLDQPQVLAGHLLDVVGIGPQASHHLHELASLGAEGGDLPLHSLDLALHLPHPGEALAAEGQRGQRRRAEGDEDQPAAAHWPRLRKTARPAQTAAVPSSSSMRSSWLYLAVRSPRASEPVLIWPALTPTERSATKASSVSPDRWEMTVPHPARLASSTAASVSVSVPI